MARNTHKHQRKIAKQKAKRQSRKRDIARRQTVGLEGLLRRASTAPILDCLLPDDLWEQGIGQVLISRELPNQQVAVAVFLVDVWCLGVKDVFADIVPKSEYKERILAGLHEQFDMRSRRPEDVRKLIEGAVAYAAKFGLQPHADYRDARAIFGEIDAAACSEEFEFGQDGKPHYFAGPYETAEQSRWIVQCLRDHAGEGNFHFTVPVAGDEWDASHGMPNQVLTSDAEFDDLDYGDAADFDADEPDSPEPKAPQRKLFGWLPGWSK